MKTRRRAAPAFGLIEILVVVVILAILAVVLIPRLTGAGRNDKKAPSPPQRARQVAGNAYIGQINQAISMYKMDNENQPPPNLQALKTYGVTDEMLIDPNTRRPLSYDPATGVIAGGGNGIGRTPGF